MHSLIDLARAGLSIFEPVGPHLDTLPNTLRQALRVLVPGDDRWRTDGAIVSRNDLHLLRSWTPRRVLDFSDAS